MAPFFQAHDHLGHHHYFRTPADAQRFQETHGGYVLETTPRRIWRVTTHTAIVLEVAA
jgi:hypothetical protein